MKQAKDWRDMMAWSADLLRRSTGEDVAAWNERVRQTGIDTEPALRAWLREQGVRLEGVEPEGRLLPAKSMSNVPVRVPLRSVDDVDDEVRTLLQRAYDENS